MLVELDDEHTKCSICTNKFSCDIDNTHQEIRKHLPVLSSSQKCDHWFCHGCILREQLRVAEGNAAKVPKWIKCMICREKTSFNPAEPKYHRLLIDLLGRGQEYAASKVKVEDNEIGNADVDAQFDSESTASMNIKVEESDVDTVGYEYEEEKEEAQTNLVQIQMEEGEIVETDTNGRDSPVEIDSASDVVHSYTSTFNSSESNQHAGKVDQLCFVCKEVKVRDCFSYNQLRKKDCAKCKDCILAEQKKKAKKAEKSKSRSRKGKEQKKKKSCSLCRAADEEPHIVYSHSAEECKLYGPNGSKKLANDRRNEATKPSASGGDNESSVGNVVNSSNPSANEQSKTPCSRCIKNGKTNAAKNHTDHQCRTFDALGNRKKKPEELEEINEEKTQDPSIRQELQTLRRELRELSRSQSEMMREQHQYSRRQSRFRSNSRSRSRSRSPGRLQNRSYMCRSEVKERSRYSRRRSRSSRRRSHSRSRSRSRSTSSNFSRNRGRSSSPRWSHKKTWRR